MCAQLLVAAAPRTRTLGRQRRRFWGGARYRRRLLWRRGEARCRVSAVRGQNEPAMAAAAAAATKDSRSAAATAPGGGARPVRGAAPVHSGPYHSRPSFTPSASVPSALPPRTCVSQLSPALRLGSPRGQRGRITTPMGLQLRRRRRREPRGGGR